MMAKKSEFAQKLLDDLRLRKERIASGTAQSYGQSHTLMVVAQETNCQYNKGHQKNRREAGANKTATYNHKTDDNKHRRSSSCDGSFEFKQSSNKDAIKTVTDFRSSERKGNLKISSFHLKEVSEGAQKLTNIIAACSEERYTGKYSIEIGKELFQSTKDLFESLTMLTELQEAADIITTHRKSRIKLLKCDNESKKSRNSGSTLNMVSSGSRSRSNSHIDEISCKSMQEKRGVSNIVAKLMGLVEVSQHSNSENEIRRDDSGGGSDSLRSCNRVVNKLKNDMKIAEEKSRALKIQEKQTRRATNNSRQVPISDQKRRTVILPRKEKHETKTDIRNLSKTGIELSKRKVLGQSDRNRQVDRMERRSGRNGLHKINKTEHQYHETQKQHNRRLVTASAKVSSVLTRDIINPNDDQTTVKEHDHNLISKDQEVVAGSKTSNTLTLKEDLLDRSQSETLNEEETELKRQLILNPNFRNRAKTLFDIQIGEKQDCDYTENDDKHLFETAYEIMEMKSRRQDHHELKFNTLKLQSLNDLVKQLCKDFEILRCYGGVWNDDDIGGNLLKMVERDVYGRELDVNCMWDYGWNSDWCFALSEKDGTVEEVEKCIVDDLLDDLLHDI